VTGRLKHKVKGVETRISILTERVDFRNRF